MDHLGASILVLTLAGVRHRQHLAGCLGTHEVDARVLHGEPRPDVPVDPLDVRLSLGTGPLGHEVVDVVRPVLDGGVGDAAPGQRDELDDC